jgi:hypothetical protein
MGPNWAGDLVEGHVQLTRSQLAQSPAPIVVRTDNFVVNPFRRAE